MAKARQAWPLQSTRSPVAVLLLLLIAACTTSSVAGERYGYNLLEALQNHALEQKPLC